MSRRRVIGVRLVRAVSALALAGVVAAAPSVAAGGAPGRPPARDAPLWATVNVCDTTGHPDGVGVRGSMPGTGDRRDELFMRLQLQYLRRADGQWRPVGRSGDSGFLDVGSGTARARQVGRTFTVSPPAGGQPAFVLRGVATFEWRRAGAVLRRARRTTQSGHPGTPGADPAGFSAAVCSIR